MSARGLDLVLDARLLHRPMSGMERVQRNLLASLRSRPEVRRLRAFVERGEEGWRERLPGGVEPIEVGPTEDGLAALLGDEPPDVYHLTFFPDRRPRDVLLAASARATVVSAADAILHRHPEYFPDEEAHAAHVRFTRALVRIADRVVSYTDAARRDAVRTIGAPAERCEIVSHGVDPQLARDDGREEDAARLARLGIDGDFLLYVGKDYPHKDLPTALDALRRTTGAPPLVVAGARVWFGPVEGRTLDERLADPALAGRVRFVDAPDDETVRALLRAARALVFPSREEGFGLPPIEAAWFGTPVIAARSPAVCEVMGDDAFWFEPGDREGLGRRIEEVLGGGPEVREIVERARRRARAHTWERVAEQLVGVYERAAAEARERRVEKFEEALRFLAREPERERLDAAAWMRRCSELERHARELERQVAELRTLVPRWSLRRRIRKIVRRWRERKGGSA